MEIKVRLTPRASRNEVKGWKDVLLVRVTAPPVDGEANRALCRLLAKRIGVAPSRISVVKGERFREKRVRIDGVNPSALADLFASGG